jgi:hypothetical protein
VFFKTKFSDGLLGDAVAFNTDEELLTKLRTWADHLESIFKLLEQANSAPPEQREKALRELGESVLGVLNVIARGRELSISMLQNLIVPLRPLLPGQPGRPAKDYSREYEWKKTQSWSQVTRRSLIENPEIREEFSGRTYDSLTLEERQHLTNRIREGVRNYAERNKKPFPIESTTAKPNRKSAKYPTE